LWIKRRGKKGSKALRGNRKIVATVQEPKGPKPSGKGTKAHFKGQRSNVRIRPSIGSNRKK